MARNIEIPFGWEKRIITVPDQNLIWIAEPNSCDPIADIRQAVTEAIRHPIGSAALPEIVKEHGTKTVLLLDDGTRPTPQHLILPVLLDELNAAGVPDADITGLIAVGTHRRMSPQECKERYGPDVAERIAVKNLSQDPNSFVDLGTSPLGVPVQVSRQYLESDVSIAVGSIVPHMYAGWSGGAKMVQPGVSSPETTAKTHLMAGPRVYETLGQIDNPVRKEMEDIAVQTSLKFIVNVVLDRQGKVATVVAGDVIGAHRAGVEVARQVYGVEVGERPDIVVAGAHPADRDLWQGFKAVNNSGMLAKDGGTLILLISAPEGIAPDHPEMFKFGTMPSKAVQAMVDCDEVTDGVAAATHMALNQTRKRVTIELVTDNIPNAQTEILGLSAVTDFDVALENALARHGNHATIGVVTHGADIMGSAPR